MELDYLDNYANLKSIVVPIVNKSHLQKKKILKFHKNIDASYFVKAEEFANNFIQYLKNENINFDYVIDAYLKLCADMMVSQLYFYEHKRYPLNKQSDAFKKVYDNINEIKSYMIGVAISQFLWPTHYAMYSFFIKKITNFKINVKNYLEIGCGHGLFLVEVIKKFNKSANFEIVDISKTSIEITKSIINFLVKDKIKINYLLSDIFKIDFKKKFEFITMGEVLEHVDRPDLLLKKTHNLISENGKMFLSTCVDCPSIDHVYHFKSIKEIEDMINSCGFKIIENLILPVEDKPMNEIIKNKITINYCALLKKNGNISKQT